MAAHSIFFNSRVRSYKHAEHLLATIKIGSSSRYERFREHTTVDDGRREWTVYDRDLRRLITFVAVLNPDP